MTATDDRKRLEYLRQALRAESISWGELNELQGLAEHIEPGDVELLEAAGVPEFPEEDPVTATITAHGKTESDLLDALNEAVRRIEGGCTTGFDSNDDSSFNFTVTEEEA
jgi:hypothetical protein